MNILILGGTNLIGPWVINALLKQGHRITVFNRGQTPSILPKTIKSIRGDRRRLNKYKAELKQTHPEVVIDMIAMTASDAQQLVDIFSGTIRKFVILSSGDVYMAHEKLTQAHSEHYEATPLNENSLKRKTPFPYRQYTKNQDDLYYMYDKNSVEQIIQSSATDSTILRLPFVYGPGDYSRLMPYLKNMQKHQPEIILDHRKSKWKSTRGYAENMAAAIITSISDSREGKFIYNVGEKEGLTEKQWIENMAEIMNWHGSIVETDTNELPNELQEPYDWDQDIVYDTTKIRSELQYQEVISRIQALKNTIEWALANI